MNILLTGSQGYVGPSVIHKLKESFPNSKLIGIDLGFFQSKISNLEVAPEILLSRLIIKDIRQIIGCTLKYIPC